MAVLTTTTNYPLINSNTDFTLVGPNGSGLVILNGHWQYRSTTTGSSSTGPSVPPPGPDIYYWYTETSGTNLGDVFTMELIDTLDTSVYNYLIDFWYSNYGFSGGGECLVQYWNGASWVTVQTIGWSTTDSSWHAATQIDLSSYSNADGKLRWHFTTGGTTAFQNDFGLDDITFTVEVASSSSSSLSSSSLSSSSSSLSSSSYSSSSLSSSSLSSSSSSLSSSSSSSSLSSSSSSLSSSSLSSSSTSFYPLWWGTENEPVDGPAGLGTGYTIMGLDAGGSVPVSGYVTAIELFTTGTSTMDFAAFNGTGGVGYYTDTNWIQNVPITNTGLNQLDENVDYLAGFAVSAGQYLGAYNNSTRIRSLGVGPGEIYDSGDQIGDGSQSYFSYYTGPRDTQLRFLIERNFSFSSSSASSSSTSSSSTSFYPLWWGTANQPADSSELIVAGYTVMPVDAGGSVPTSGYITQIEIFTTGATTMDFAAFSGPGGTGTYTDERWVQSVPVTAGFNKLNENADYTPGFSVSAGEYLGVYNNGAGIEVAGTGPGRIHDYQNQIGSGSPSDFIYTSNKDLQLRFLIDRNFSISSSSTSSSSTSSSSSSVSSSSSSVSSSSSSTSSSSSFSLNSNEGYWYGKIGVPSTAQSVTLGGFTYVPLAEVPDYGQPNPSAGYIDLIQFYLYSGGNLKFSTFTASGNDFRDDNYVALPTYSGSTPIDRLITARAGIDFNASDLPISAGQYVGFYGDSARIRGEIFGDPGRYNDGGDHIGDNSFSTFTLVGGNGAETRVHVAYSLSSSQSSSSVSSSSESSSSSSVSSSSTSSSSSSSSTSSSSASSSSTSSSSASSSSSSNSSSSNSSSSSSTSSSSSAIPGYWWGVPKEPSSTTNTSTYSNATYVQHEDDPPTGFPGAGYITKIQTYVTSASSFQFAVFSSAFAGTQFTDEHWIPSGSLSTGLQTLVASAGDYDSRDLPVSIGEYAGFYSLGTIARGTVSGAGFHFRQNNQIGDGTPILFYEVEDEWLQFRTFVEVDAQFSSSSTSSSSSSISSSSISSSSSSSASGSSSSTSSSSSSLSSSSTSSSSSSFSSSSSTSSSSTSLVIQSLKHFWYTLTDDEGVPRDGELVHIYESGTTTPMYIYDQNGLPISNPVTTSTGTSAASATGGVFEFYLKDLMWNNEPIIGPSGYAWDDRIKLQWQHVDGSIASAGRIMTWGDFYPVYTIEGVTTPRQAAFDPLDFSLITPPVSSDVDYNYKNKAISNALVCKIESHRLTNLIDYLSSSSLSSSSSSTSSSSSSSSSSLSSSSSSLSSSSSSSSSSLSSSSSSLSSSSSSSSLSSSSSVSSSSSSSSLSSFSSSSSSSTSSSSSSRSSSSSSISSSSSSTTPSGFTFLLHAADSASAEGIILEGPASQETFGDQGLSYIYRSAMQSDGRVVFPCYDGDGRVLVKCYEAGSLTSESWATYITGSAYAYYSDIAILNNGNILVAWGDYSTERAEFAILSPEGSIVVGMTNGIGTADYNDDDYEVFITLLEDGGFCLTWADYYVTTIYASLWNANGTVRQARTATSGEEYESWPIQMPTGGVGNLSGLISYFDALQDYSFWNSETDLTEEYDFVDIGYGGDYMTCAKLDTWTDRVALIDEYTGTIRGNILKDDETLIVDAKIILSTGYVSVNNFMALPDGTFLLQATGASDYGLNYWILDENLDIVSGPTAAFTGLTSNNYTNIKGCAV